MQRQGRHGRPMTGRETAGSVASEKASVRVCRRPLEEAQGVRGPESRRPVLEGEGKEAAGQSSCHRRGLPHTASRAAATGHTTCPGGATC